MPTFPQLHSGAIAQYPLERSKGFRTVVTRYLDGTDQRFIEFASPVRRWVLKLEKLTSDEAGILESFFADRQGRSGLFAFTDPHDGVEYPTCVFEGDSSSMAWESENDCHSTLVIRTVRV